MKFKKIPIFVLAAAFMMAPTMGLAWDWGDGDDEEELELDEAYLYFELNDTDGDLGIHGKADGDAWKRKKIEAPNERTLLNITVRSKLRRQGLTELFFESAEPTFDELDPEVFFARFPEGVYEWEGLTTEYEEIEGEVFLSQRIPAAPVVASVGLATEPVFEQEEDEDGNPVFDEEGNPVLEQVCWDPGDVDEVVISWNLVTHTHALLGSDTGAPLGDNSVIYYEFVAEVDGTEFKSTALVPPNTDSWTISEDFIEMAEGLMVEDEETGMEVPVEEIKFEIIVRVESGDGVDDDGEPVESKPGNQSAVESCFDI